MLRSICRFYVHRICKASQLGERIVEAQVSKLIIRLRLAHTMFRDIDSDLAYETQGRNHQQGNLQILANVPKLLCLGLSHLTSYDQRKRPEEFHALLDHLG